MSGDRKEAVQETADEVHQPCTPVELKIEESDWEDDHGTELHGHGSSTNTINTKKVPQASSIKLRKKRRGSLDQSMVESSHNQDRPPTPHADGHPRSGAEQTYMKEPQGLVPLRASVYDDCSDSGGSLRNEWINMRPLDASTDGVVQQGGVAATGNTGSGQGTSCWPFSRWFKKDSGN